MKPKDYLNIMQEILHYIDDGVHVVDLEGKTIIYNNSMSQLERMDQKDVIDKPLLDIFKSLNKESSTLLKVLETEKSITNQKQTYLNKDGKEITTINSTMPLIFNNQKVGALEIAKNITKIKELSDIILNLHRKISNPTQTIKNKINKYTFDNIICESDSMKSAVKIAKRACETPASVLIYGETGTGKELFAQGIHYGSDRFDKPFIAQNCAAFPESLLEGLLFGTSKGGFTGAIDRAGFFEEANGGTLLLDEINSMPLNLQAKLLRVLQEGYVRRIGASKDIPVDVRIIATTNEEPSKLLSENKLRKDLYYRLNVININIPPLRKRKEDILLLSKYFIEKYNTELKKNVERLSEASIEVMLSHEWLGNVRELQNAVYSAFCVMESEDIICEKHLPISKSVKNEGFHVDFSENSGMDLNSYMMELEKNIIENELKLRGNNISKAANNLGIKRQTLQHKLKKYNIKQKDLQ